jgi:VWFA-related protein
MRSFTETGTGVGRVMIGLAGWLMAGSLFVGIMAAQQPAPAPAADGGQSSLQLQRRDEGVTTLKTAARLVLLDVVVTDGKGSPVKGLKASDFTLMEDGVPQMVSGFQEHQPLSPEEIARAKAALVMPPNHFTNYDPEANDTGAITVFLLDALDTPVQAQMYLREQMIAYMKTVPPRTRIAIFQMDTQMHMIQGVTSDPEVLRQVVNGKRDQAVISPLLGGPAAPGYVRERMRQDFLTQGMQTLAHYLAPFPGRKNLIWFTGSVPVTVYGPGFGVPFPDISSFIDDFSKTTDVLTLSRIAVYPVDSRGLQTDPAFSAQNGRGGGGGMGRFETRQFYQHGDLDDVAEATGGRAFYNTNGLKEAIAEVVDTGSNYYTLSYTPANHTWDGGYRKLQVKVQGESGMKLEYRRGYYARNNEAAESRHIAELESPRRLLPGQPVRARQSHTMEAAMKMGAGPVRDIVFVARVTAPQETTKLKGDEPLAKGDYLDKSFRKDALREYKVHYSVSAQEMRLMPTPDMNYHGRVEFVEVVYDDKGEVVNSKSTMAQLDLDGASYGQMMQAGFGSDQTIVIPAKGSFFLRLGVHDLSGDKAGSLEIAVDQIKLGAVGSAVAARP